MDTQILNNQIKTDLEELRKDVNFGMYDFVGAMKLYLKEVKRITDKMTKLRELESEEEANAVDLAVDTWKEEKYGRI